VYFKVLQVGAVKAGDLLECISQKAQQPKILEVYQKIKENIK
jgi:MOSC domain-containing protein YiiM